MHKLIVGLMAILMFIQVSGQSQKFGTYYEQRKSLFEVLPDTKNEIIFLGNSITDGCEWQELLGNKHVKNRGISGDISAGVLNRLPEIVSAKPRKIFLLIGINDLARGVSADSLFGNICLIASTISTQSPGTTLYIQSILPVNESFGLFKGHTDKTPLIIDVNSRLLLWCSENRYEFIDLFSSFKNTGDDSLNPAYTNDGLHLTGPGYLLWADIIRPYLKKKR